MYARILGNKLIQLCDTQKKGYHRIVEHAKPIDRDGYIITWRYEIIFNKVHKTYHYIEEVIEDVNNEC